MELAHKIGTQATSKNGSNRNLSITELARKEQEALDERFAAAALEYQANTLKEYLQELASEYQDKPLSEFNDAKQSLERQISEIETEAAMHVKRFQAVNAEVQAYNNAIFQQKYSKFINRNAKPTQGQKGFIPHELATLNEAGREEFPGLPDNMYFKGVELRNGKHFVIAAVKIPIEYLEPVTNDSLAPLKGMELVGTDYAVKTLEKNGFEVVRPAKIKIVGGCELQLQYKMPYSVKKINLYLYGGKAHPSRQGWVITVKDFSEEVVDEKVPSYLLMSNEHVKAVVGGNFAECINFHRDNIAYIPPFEMICKLEDFGLSLPSVFEDYELSSTLHKANTTTFSLKGKGGQAIFTNCEYDDAKELIDAMFKDKSHASVVPSGLDPQKFDFDLMSREDSVFPEAERTFAYPFSKVDTVYILAYHSKNTTEYLKGWTLSSFNIKNEEVSILESGLDDITDTGYVVADIIKEHESALLTPVNDQAKTETAHHTANSNWVVYAIIFLAAIALLAILVSSLK